ncbi:hypothetical protein LFL96_06655 [Paraburkholderia sp. D15]|uniref:hypothetical protein n=1 Tax=Paraburkholderia sp. D15 TaxID=2880218 RepID=UPI00247AAA64|nr:hypothetical protein [Paraburkholderia sp. D15]WGS51177.1 hypothetical protein LFL96_06655 [Paraburkholderia sp. D15]
MPQLMQAALRCPSRVLATPCHRAATPVRLGFLDDHKVTVVMREQQGLLMTGRRNDAATEGEKIAERKACLKKLLAVFTTPRIKFSIAHAIKLQIYTDLLHIADRTDNPFAA